MKLTNRTVLFIGNELPFTLSLIKHLIKMNNKLVVICNIPAVYEQMAASYPQITILNINIYDEADRSRIIDELSRRHLYPSCVIYNELSFAEGMIKGLDTIQFQAAIEAYFTSITHIDELLLPLLETEADATISYILPNISLLHFKHTSLLYVLYKTLLDYIALLDTIHSHIRFISFKHPFKCSCISYRLINKKDAKLDKLTTRFLDTLKNFKSQL